MNPSFYPVLSLVVIVLVTLFIMGREVYLTHQEVKVPSRGFSIAYDFGRLLGGPDDGPYSGESLRIFVMGMLEEHENLVINLDGTFGYGSSFLHAAFKGMALEVPNLRQRLSFISEEDSSLITEIWEYAEEN